MFWEGEKGVPITPFLKPLSLDFPSIEGMRNVVKTLADSTMIPAHSFTITAEDGGVERWYKLDGSRRRKDA